MKYLFINVVAGQGSTGRIAADQCRALSKQGHRCVLAYGRGISGCGDIETYAIGGKLDYYGHAFSNRLLDNQGFCSRRATRVFLDWVKDYDPDVICLHNLHGYYLNLPMLFGYLKTCGKEIIWTLHDCWSFTGHCAHFAYAGCDRWKTGCHHCPEKGSYPKSLVLDNSRRNYQRKKALFTGIPNLRLRLPSYWLDRQVAESFLKDYPREVVYNPINREIFQPTASDFRRKHGLEQKKIVLGVASVWGQRKGLQDMVELSKLLPETYKMVLVGLNEKEMAAMPENILGLPKTESLTELAQIYTAADVYVNPSPEESFGMTTWEAICCGTQAVVYQGTACQEVVDTFGGIAVPKGPENLLAAVLDLTKGA